MDKEMLIRIYNTMLLIETRGDSTLMMADCLRGLQAIINAPEEEKKEEKEKKK